MNNFTSNNSKGFTLLALYSLIVLVLSSLLGRVDLQSKVSECTGLMINFVTYSAGHEGFLITLLVLISLSWKRSANCRPFMVKILQLMLLLIIGFKAKVGLKTLTESPRPYTELLSYELLIPNPAHFYKLSKAQQDFAIDEISNSVSEWRTRNWKGERDYSFPSGHTLFVAICLAFFGAIFWEQRQFGWCIVLGCWASAVAFSRLWIGMHHPIDLIGSIVCVAVIYFFVAKTEPILARFSSGLIGLL